MPDVDLGSVEMAVKVNAAGISEGVATFEAGLRKMVESSDKAGKKIENALGGVGVQVGHIGDDLKKSAAPVEDGANRQAAALTMLAAAAGKAYSIITSAIESGVKAANEYKGALIGLNSVGTKKGFTSTELTEAVSKVTDEFFDATAAATSLKNLLSRGYGLDEATQVINRLKDAAAYGRQSSYTLRDAVVSATEGIKNENSVLVDNAGVTKNVAKMWEEYAKERGVATSSLTQAQKVEAEYQGILRETTAQVGDLAKMHGTLEGSQAATANQGTLLARAFGEAVTPMEQIKTEITGDFLYGLTGIAQSMPEVTAGATAMTQSFMGMMALVSVINVVKNLFSALSMAKAAVGPVAAIAAALGLIVTVVTSIKNAQEELKKAEEQRVQANKDAVTQQQERLEKLSTLTERYKELSSKQTLSYSEQKEMVDIQNQLATAYGATAGNMDSLTGSMNGYLSVLEKTYQAELRTLQVQQKQVSQDAYVKANSNELIALLKKQADIKEKIAKAEATIADPGIGGQMARTSAENLLRDYTDLRGVLQTGLYTQLEQVEQQLSQHTGFFSEWFSAAVDEGVTSIRTKGGTVNAALAEQLKTMFSIDLSKAGSAGDANAYVDNMVQSLLAAVSDPKVSEAITTVQTIASSAMAGITPNDEQKAQFAEAWEFLSAEDGPLSAFANQLSTLTDESATTLLPAIMAMVTGFQLLGTEAGYTGSTLENAGAQLTAAADEANSSASSLEECKTKCADLTKQAEALNKKVGDISKIKANVKAFQDAKRVYDQCKKSGKDTTKSMADMQAASGKLHVTMAETADGVEAASKQIDGMGQAADGAVAELQSQFDTLTQAVAVVQAQMYLDLATSGDTSGAQAALDALYAKIEEVKAAADAAGITLTSTGGGGGGGGGGKQKTAYDEAIENMEHLDAIGKLTARQELARLEEIAATVSMDAEERLDLEERLYAAREKLRKEELAADYDKISHSKHMGELTLEQELELLEKIAQAHKLNAEERIEWEERVYDARQAILERDTSNVDRLTDGLQSALSNRYQAMLDAEIARLDESREAWQTWSDESVAAVQAQIDALDALSKQQDNEAKDAEELRKIAKLQQSIQFEQDAYNRAKLTQQLEQAMASRESRLNKLQIEEQKAALQQQIAAIQNTAQHEQDALDDQQEAIEAAYAAQMTSAAIQAEAEQMLMQQSQESILTLIAGYAPDYNALGQTLGERLVDGFRDRVGELERWFASFNAQIAAAQQDVANASLASAATLYQQNAQRVDAAAKTAPIINMEQTNNFTVPVETPGDTARRIAKANEELGAQLAAIL